MRFSFSNAGRGIQVSEEFTQVEMEPGTPLHLFVTRDINWPGPDGAQVIVPPYGMSLVLKKRSSDCTTSLYVLQNEDGQDESLWQIALIYAAGIVRITRFYPNMLETVHEEPRTNIR